MAQVAPRRSRLPVSAFLAVLTAFAVLASVAYAATPRTGTFKAVRGQVQ